MAFSLLAVVLWAAGFLGNAAVLAVLFLRRRVRIVPWFTAWIVFNLVYTIVLFAVYRLGTKHTYAMTYWVGGFVDLALQVAMIIEIASYVFRRGGSWVEGAKARLASAAVCSVIAGVLMAWLMVPVTHSQVSALEARVDLGCTVLITLLFTAIMVVSHQLGVSWRSLLLREGYGVAIWSILTFCTDTLHAYWRTAEHFTAVENTRIIAYLAALGYWSYVFWLPEVLPFVPNEIARRQASAARQALEYPRNV